jgi:glycerophosphoryl diester phosphodiesterase
VGTKRTHVNWISHRGVRARAVENTRLAFQDAVAAGFQTLETDLRTTRDGVIVLAHDDDLHHISDEHRTISESSYAEIARVSLTDGQRLLRFEEFVSEFTPQQWLLDIKPECAVQVIDALADLMSNGGLPATLCSQARFLCWNWRQQRYARSRLPGATFMARPSECYRAGLTCLCKAAWLGGIQRGKTYGLTARLQGISLFTATVVDAYHRRGARVLAYRPASASEIELALRAGVDEIILDFPYEGILDVS